MPAGQIGTVYFADAPVFSYHNDPEKTKRAYNARGWSTLGDVGYLDDDGFLYLTDRKSYMIISGGVNIYPQETEDVLITHPAVADVAVFGVPNEEMGEEVKAVVQPHDMARAGKELEAELMVFCRKHLSPIKCPQKHRLRGRAAAHSDRQAGEAASARPILAEKRRHGSSLLVRPFRHPASANIRSRFVEGINGLRMHVLEAGFETRGRPCLLLLHGFPELAYSWRKVMPALAEAGYHVIAPDQRGYGRTTGWDPSYDGDLASFRLLNLVRDAFGLVSAFGYRSVDAVIGHDFGSSVAAWCALVRPDIFRSAVLMSAPFAGPPALAVRHSRRSAAPKPVDPVHRELAALSASAQALPVVLFDTAGQRARCIAHRKACTTSCAPIIITRARTGKPTRHIR